MANAFVLVIGIADYRHMNKLPLVKDATDVASLLIHPDHCGYPRDNVRLLADEQATKTALRQGLAELAERSDPDSTVVIYFSGHGGRIEAGPYAGEYLLPVEA